jgi:hypothetical protein
MTKLNNLQLYKGTGYKFMTLEDVRKALEDIMNDYNLKEEDLFGIPIGINPVEFDKAMKQEREIWLQKNTILQQ